MKIDKKNIIITILVVLLLISIYFLFFVEDKNDIAFENNLRCSQYIKEQNKEINEIANLAVNEKSIVSAPKIFFSKKLNTCVSAYSISDPRENGLSGFYIENLLNNDSIFVEGARNNETIDGVSLSDIVRQKYYEKIKELE